MKNATFTERSILVLLCFFAVTFSLRSEASPPTMLCGSYRVAQGDDCNNPGALAYDSNGNPLGLRVGDVRQGVAPIGQFGQFGQINQNQVGQMMQVGGPLINSSGKCEIVGGIAGGVAGNLIAGRMKGNNRAAGTILGVLAGGFLGNKYCEPDVVPPQRQAVMQEMPSQRVMQQSQPQQDECGRGKIVAKLDLPGHEQDGDYVCMYPDDPHRAGSNNRQSRHVSSSNSEDRCDPGLVWSKLNWPGHPQHDTNACMKPDDPHRG